MPTSIPEFSAPNTMNNPKLHWSMGPGLPTVSPEIGQAQVRLLYDAAPYLRLAFEQGEADAFYERLFNLYFVRWPLTPRDVEDIPFVLHRKQCIIKVLKQDLFWFRSSTLKIQTIYTWRKFLRIKEAAFGITKENEIISDNEEATPTESNVAKESKIVGDTEEVDNTSKRQGQVVWIFDTDDEDDGEVEEDKEVRAKAVPAPASHEAPPSPFNQAKKRALLSQETTSDINNLEPATRPRPRPRPVKKSRTDG